VPRPVMMAALPFPANGRIPQRGPNVGVVALQGAFREHEEAFVALGAHPVEVRTPGDLEGIDALVLPGGESTTMSLLLHSSGLFDAIEECLAEGMPVMATCAGLILLARSVVGGRSDQRSFGVLDVGVARNGYGRQVDSFETGVEVAGLAGGLFPGVFIRAPVITSTGAGVEVLGTVDGCAVLVRQGAVLASTFHPELSDDLRLHQLFLGRR
jgi:pyridoxal 5'-phosphate synthase pdxT subunit